ncbi:hypothetical protein OQA88_898 [Cercophora sp. LCS_1]
MASLLRRIFRRKKPAPLVCSVGLDVDSHADHTHTAACFAPIEPLAVVELFQSQGCHACPPALPGILAGARQPNVALLSYNVTLFDQLGWADTFASSKWDARQRAYARAWGRNNLYTPMVVANGAVDGPGVGAEGQGVADLVAQARQGNGALGWHVYVDVNDTDVRIDSDRQVGEVGPYEIVVVVYDPAPQTVKVKKGPNKGTKIEHVNLVKEVARIGEWTGGDVTVPLPVPVQAGYDAVVMLQAPGGGPIVAAAKM